MDVVNLAARVRAPCNYIGVKGPRTTREARLLRLFCDSDPVTEKLERLPSVLLSFRAANVRSFKDPFELSLRAGTMSNKAVVREVSTRDSSQPVPVLPSAGLYGANGSGKTNVLRVMHDMRSHVLNSFRSGSPGGVTRHPFLLDSAQRQLPSRFEIELILEGVRLEYGFEADDAGYTSEWAHHFPRGRRALLFSRAGGQIELGTEHRAKGRSAAELLRPNALFLSTATAAAHPGLTPLYNWFSRNLILADARTRALRQGYTTGILANDNRRNGVLDVLRLVDAGVTDATKLTMDPVMRERVRRAIRIMNGQEGETDSADDTPLPDLGVRLVHQTADGEPVEFNIEDESLGTLVWFGVVGPVVDALADGCVFLADEIDASLHPHISRQLVRVFQSPLTNPHRAQLIFNSHDASLLGDSDEQILGRDQVWLVDKGADGASHLTQLSTLRARKDAAIGRRYLAGLYGAIPALSDENVDRTILHALGERKCTDVDV